MSHPSTPNALALYVLNNTMLRWPRRFCQPRSLGSHRVLAATPCRFCDLVLDLFGGQHDRGPGSGFWIGNGQRNRVIMLALQLREFVHHRVERFRAPRLCRATVGIAHTSGDAGRSSHQPEPGAWSSPEAHNHFAISGTAWLGDTRIPSSHDPPNHQHGRRIPCYVSSTVHRRRKTLRPASMVVAPRRISRTPVGEGTLSALSTMVSMPG